MTVTLVNRTGFDVQCIWFTEKTHINSMVRWKNKFVGFMEPKNLIWIKITPLHSWNMKTWTTINSKEIIGPFFKYDTINMTGYFTVHEQFVTMQQKLEELPAMKWFTEDKARHHSKNHVFCSLNKYFENRKIVMVYTNFTCAGVDFCNYSPSLNSMSIFCMIYRKIFWTKTNPWHWTN